MRRVGNKAQFTPFGLWIREYCRDSGDGWVCTNLDFVLEDYKNKKLMLVEEKQSGGRLATGQRLTFKVLDIALRYACDRSKSGYEYWGFFVIQFPRSCTFPGPGMTLNGKRITMEKLVAHLNFEERFDCPPIDFDDKG